MGSFINRPGSPWKIRQSHSLIAAACASLVLSACNSDNDVQDTDLAVGAATGGQHVAIRVEAENFTGSSDRWHITSADNIPGVTPDPDPPHFSTASGNGYMELLPDTRVTHNDDIVAGENYWGDTEGGPNLKYMLNFPEPGRYYVYAKAYSTGLEDNGIHVGYDNEKPSTGKRIQLCSGKNKWTWSSAQRVPENHCGVQKTIYLDIPNAGNHEVVFYAREDGFELDQFVLLKDPDNGTQDCFMYGDRVRCTNIETGAIVGTWDIPITQTNDGNVTVAPPTPPVTIDLDIDLEVDSNNVRVDDELTYSISVDNKDNNDSATSVVVSVTLPNELTFIASNSCTENGNSLRCEFPEIPAQDEITASFTASANTTGTHRVDSQVIADQNDTAMGNNAESVEITASPAIPAYDATLSVLHGSNVIGLDGATTHLLLIRNVGLEPITGAQLELSSNALTINTDLTDCSAEVSVTCTLAEISPDQSLSLPVTISGSTPGVDALSATLLVSGDENTDENALNIAVQVASSDTVTDSAGDLVIEAEQFSSQASQSTPVEGTYNTAWFINSDGVTPTVTPDFDSTAPASAANSAYIELLPDTRTGPSDPPVLGVSNFLTGEDSPATLYNVFVNEAGIYTVNARIRANNDQDAGIHVGLDSTWPATSSAVSVCNPNGEWQWTHNTAVDGQCDMDSVATINFESPGLHTVMIAAASDGVELDKLVLRLNNTELPVDAGPDPVIYTPADIDLTIASTVHSGLYTVEVSNPDPINTAIDIDVTIEGISVDAAEQINGFDGCTADTGIVQCKVDYISANTTRTADLSIGSATAKISASLTQVNDPNTQNNSTVATPSGGGTFGMLSLASLFLLVGIRRRRNYQ
jgi:uncharacterized repeat protein (TIGR01451 family)/MYXO-CTERM domain-containing protein